jgi:phosphoribosyl-ATP pyrophosphohydrolase/phosphoribosyl-AMP cyclohydrolase
MNQINIENINFSKLQGLIPACIQDTNTMRVLMVGFMNKESLQQTISTGLVTFYSRSKNKLWVKGESSGNFLRVEHMLLDCDADSLLIYANPEGATCHTGNVSCFADTEYLPPLYWLGYLQQIIETRQHQGIESYTYRLMESGVKRIAQKVGEEGVEVALAAMGEGSEELAQEAVDLLYHLFVLLQAKSISLQTISNVIRSRRKHETSVRSLNSTSRDLSAGSRKS